MGEGFRRRSAKGSRTLPRMSPSHHPPPLAHPAAVERSETLIVTTPLPGVSGMAAVIAWARMGRAMTAPPRSPGTPPPGGSPEAPGEQDGLDLGELLKSRGLLHWKGLIDELIDRYAGWLTDYWLDDQFDLDLWPAADVIKVLVNMPLAQRGNDEEFARALAECDFLVRLARDQKTGRCWDALAQPYREFAQAEQVEPYWGLQAPWTQAAFAYWALARLKPDRT
jgi:hypothetical protein